jgi:hypothetical protein
MLLFQLILWLSSLAVVLCLQAACFLFFAYLSLRLPNVEGS